MGERVKHCANCGREISEQGSRSTLCVDCMVKENADNILRESPDSEPKEDRGGK